MKKIVLFGAGGFGQEVAEIIKKINFQEPTYELLGFLDEGIKEININGYPILGDKRWMLEHPDILCTCTIADAKIRSQIQEELSNYGIRFETIISTNVYIPKSTVVGAGCVLYSDVGISVNVNISDGVLLNHGVQVGHGTSIGKYASIMTGTAISGNCQIGKMTSIGGHAYIVPGKKVGDYATVAAGSIVFSNVKPGTTVLGNPAKRMRELER